MAFSNPTPPIVDPRRLKQSNNGPINDIDPPTQAPTLGTAGGGGVVSRPFIPPMPAQRQAPDREAMAAITARRRAGMNRPATNPGMGAILPDQSPPQLRAMPLPYQLPPAMDFNSFNRLGGGMYPVGTDAERAGMQLGTGNQLMTGPAPVPSQADPMDPNMRWRRDGTSYIRNPQPQPPVQTGGMQSMPVPGTAINPGMFGNPMMGVMQAYNNYQQMNPQMQNPWQTMLMGGGRFPIQ